MSRRTFQPPARTLAQWLVLAAGQRQLALVGLAVAVGLGLIAVARSVEYSSLRLDRASADVQRIIDARTLRLALIDGPTGQPPTLDIQLAGVRVPPSWATASQGRLRTLVENHTVTMVPMLNLAQRPGVPIDALIYRDDGLLINQALLIDGYAQADPASAGDLADWFERAARTARNRGRGLWPEPHWQNDPKMDR